MAEALIVDDEADVLFLLRLILEMNGYAVREARHGRAALDQVNAHTPDIIITDLMMPVMTGGQLIEILRRDPRTSTVPIILLSANPNGVQGADVVMRKPFDQNELLGHLRTLVVGGAA